MDKQEIIEIIARLIWDKENWQSIKSLAKKNAASKGPGAIFVEYTSDDIASGALGPIRKKLEYRPLLEMISKRAPGVSEANACDPATEFVIVLTPKEGGYYLIYRGELDEDGFSSRPQRPQDIELNLRWIQSGG